jgi:uncharacterized RDD family membrane protein YckC
MDLKKSTASPQSSQKEKTFPGCFKKSTAFFLDQIVIALIGMGLFYPFSGFISALSVHDWLPGYLVGVLYYMVMESSLFKSASLAKMAFSMQVRTTSGNKISMPVSLLRYLLITLPFYNNAVSQSIATTVGITDISVGGTGFLVLVGILFVGNTLFMVLHPQKRGLHDVLTGTVVVRADMAAFQVQSWAKKPVFAGLAGLVVLGIVFGNMYCKQGKDPDFADIKTLTAKIKQQSRMENISVSYRKFVVQDKITVFSIDVHIPLSFDKFGDAVYTQALSDKLYPLVKKLNTNPKVNTISLVLHTRKFIGAFPISKYVSNSKELSEISIKN